MKQILLIMLSMALLLGCRTIKKTESFEKDTGVTEAIQKTEQSSEKESLKQDVSIKFDSVKLGEIIYPFVVERKNKDDTIVYVTIKNVSDINSNKESGSEKEYVVFDEVKKDSVTHISSSAIIEKDAFDWLNFIRAFVFVFCGVLIILKIEDIIKFIRKLF